MLGLMVMQPTGGIMSLRCSRLLFCFMNLMQSVVFQVLLYALSFDNGWNGIEDRGLARNSLLIENLCVLSIGGFNLIRIWDRGKWSGFMNAVYVLLPLHTMGLASPFTSALHIMFYLLLK